MKIIGKSPLKTFRIAIKITISTRIKIVRENFTYTPHGIIRFAVPQIICFCSNILPRPSIDILKYTIYDTISIISKFNLNRRPPIYSIMSSVSFSVCSFIARTTFARKKQRYSVCKVQRTVCLHNRRRVSKYKCQRTRTDRMVIGNTIKRGKHNRVFNLIVY